MNVKASINTKFNADQHQLRPHLYASMSTNSPEYTQNQHSMLVPTAQMPINQHGNSVYQQKRLQQHVDSTSSVSITFDHPRSGFTYEELQVATNMFSA
jgi:hypothetical protein